MDVIFSIYSKNWHGGSAYRGRAAERRALDGGFGVGPGQMRSAVSDNSGPSSPVSVEEAAGEALNISFGAGRYGRRILGSVGWKEVITLKCMQFVKFYFRCN